MRFEKSKVLMLSAFFCFASAMFGQTTVNFGITGAGPTGDNLAGVYTDPYTGCLGCTSTSNLGVPLQIFCDDFTDDVSPPEFWKAYSTNLSAFTGSNNVSSVYYSSPATTPTEYSGLPTNLVSGWNATQTFSQTTDYIAVAILAAESLQQGTGNPTAQNDLSFALWGVFDSTLLDQAHNEYGTLPTADLQAAQTDLESALLLASHYSSGSQFESLTGVNATVYTAACPGSPGCSNGQTGVDTSSSRPQEFVVVTSTGNGFAPVPEASTPAILVSYLIGMALIGLAYRRRHSRLLS